MGRRGRSNRMVVGYTTTRVIKVVSSNHDHILDTTLSDKGCQ